MSESNGHEYVTYDFLAKFKPPEPVKEKIESWGRYVLVRKLNAGEYERITYSIKEQHEQRFAAVAKAICNPDGTPLFAKEYMTNTDHAVVMLAKQDRDAFEELWNVFAKVNGFLPEEELAKNSETTQA